MSKGTVPTHTSVLSLLVTVAELLPGYWITQVKKKQFRFPKSKGSQPNGENFSTEILLYSSVYRSIFSNS